MIKAISNIKYLINVRKFEKFIWKAGKTSNIISVCVRERESWFDIFDNFK